MKRLFFKSVVLVVLLALLMQAAQLGGMDVGGIKVVHAAPYSYTNAVSYNVPDGSSSTNNGCAYWPATRYFLVDDYFTVNDLDVEFTQAHASRGQIQVKLSSPDGTTRVIVPTSTDLNANYDIILDGDSGGALNDGSIDDIATPIDRTVQQTLLNDFDGKNAHGHWTMTICDNTYNGTTPSQLFIQARLVFDGTPSSAPSYSHKQGPAIVETYFIPWPEDQVWTSFGSIFPTSCSSYASFRDNYDAAPRVPIVSYTVITLTLANTVITFDQWEDGYEANLTFPTQPTTQVWGDGDLANGVAPGDADDLLAGGQVITLNDVMLPTTLGTVIDFDGRDKVGSSDRITLTRSVWSDGSQTMLAAADEVFLTDLWGTQFYSPVGDNANLNGMFDYSAASIIAATDGTLVDIDKDGNGTYETTGVALSQGGTYFINDTGTGLFRGSGIRSNAGHPIQVNLMTANTCAGYESRTYPLLPYSEWDYSYYSPVGTLTAAGGPGNDDAPTTVSIYNPNASTIAVARDTASGYVDTTTIAANSGANIVMADATAARFYSVSTPISTTTNNVRDEFGSRSYSNNAGSVNWATDWDETGDDDNATTGSISIGGNGSRFLRFYTNAAANVGDTIERQVYDMTGYTTATLSFSYNNSSGDAGDILGVSVYGGTSWTQIATIAGNTSGTFTQDISTYIASNTRLRFSINAWSGDTDTEYIYVDNVDITFSYTTYTSPTAVFYAIASIDSDADNNQTYDWGFGLIPERDMSPFVVIGWGPGDDPTFQGSLAENAAPIWLTGGYPRGSTSTGNFSVCVDYNGDGGTILDPITGRYYDASTSLAPRSLLKVYKNKLVPPDSGAGTAGDDQTGTIIWVCGGSDAIITAAWGGDPLVTSPSKPGLDMGYTARNLPYTPTAVTGISGPFSTAGNAIHITWETANELKIVGFRLYRDSIPGGLIYEGKARVPGNLVGSSYEYVDIDSRPGKKHTYWLEVVYRDGSSQWSDPTIIFNPFRNFVPFLTY